MTYKDFVREIAIQSKETERPLSVDDVRMTFDLTRDVLVKLLKDGDKVTIKDFIKFETKVQKGRVITKVNSEEKMELPDTIVAKATLSENFKKEVKKVCEK